MPKKFRISIPILIVPLATVGGKPKKIKVGSVIKEPPAETRLINPTKTPNNNNVIKINNVTLKHPILFLLRFIIKVSKRSEERRVGKECRSWKWRKQKTAYEIET